MADEAVIFDLDAVRAARLEAKPTQYRTMRYAGRDWKVLESPNIISVLNISESGGNKGQVEFLVSYIVPEEREAFLQALKDDEALDSEVFEALMNWLANETVGRPTEESSSSAGGSSTTGDTSKADSSPQEVPVG